MQFILPVLRVLVGVLVMKTGVDLLQGEFYFSGYSGTDRLITGVFIVLIGIQIIFTAVLNRDK